MLRIDFLGGEGFGARPHRRLSYDAVRDSNSHRLRADLPELKLLTACGVLRLSGSVSRGILADPQAIRSCSVRRQVDENANPFASADLSSLATNRQSGSPPACLPTAQYPPFPEL